MSTIETVWFVCCSVLASVGIISLKQARYYDGDPNAHWKRGLPILHTPRHPYAVRAKRRGLLLTASAVALTAGGLVARSLW